MDRVGGKFRTKFSWKDKRGAPSDGLRSCYGSAIQDGVGKEVSLGKALQACAG